MSDWIPFHKRLVKGPKKSIPRALRFVLLELSLEARPTRGILDLPTDWTTLDAVHDLIGGDRREIKKALDLFTATGDPEHDAIKIHCDATRHRLEIVNFDRWAGPKTNSERQSELRSRRKPDSCGELHGQEDQFRKPRSNDSNNLQTKSNAGTVTRVTRDDAALVTGSHDSNAYRTGQDSRGENRTRERDARASAPGAPEPQPSNPVALLAEDPPEAHLADLVAQPLSVGDPDVYQMTVDVFCELWEAKYKREYALDPRGGKGSELEAFRFVAHAAVRRGGSRAEEYVRHWIGQFLRDTGTNNWLIDNRHPARSIPRSFNSYSDPPTQTEPHPAPSPEPVKLVSPEAMARSLAAIGNGGTGVVMPRPSATLPTKGAS